MKKPLVTPSKSRDKDLLDLITFFNETLGFCPNSVLTMHHRPHLAKAFINLNKAAMENHGRVTSSFKRLIGFISSNTSGCKYCQAHTIRAAERYGADAEKMQHIWDFQTHPAFTPAEKSALNFAVAASSIPNAVDDAIADELRKYWDEGEIVEILGVISLFGYLNRWNDSMGTEIESGAVESGEKYLKRKGWEEGKHRY